MSADKSRTGVTRRRYLLARVRRLLRRATYGDEIVLSKPVLWSGRSEDPVLWNRALRPSEIARQVRALRRNDPKSREQKA